MKWSAVYSYITALQPDLVEKMIGVPEADIAAYEQSLGVVFPSAYRDFLLTTGVEAGGRPLLGGFAVWNFYEVLRDPPEEYNPGEFLRISTEESADSVITRMDLYLDMSAQTPDGDCELVSIEWLLPPSREVAYAEDSTFLERIVHCSWSQLVKSRFPISRTLMGGSGIRDPQQVSQLFDRAILKLLERGFTTNSPTSARIACFIRSTSEGEVNVEVSANKNVVSVTLVSNSERLVRHLVEILTNSVRPLRIYKGLSVGL
jgi:hypothetical protein